MAVFWKSSGIHKISTWPIRRAKAWLFLVRGPSIIQTEYNRAAGKPFEVLVPENRYIMVSSAKHIKEIDDAPHTVLSLQAAAKDLLQPRYTMHNFNWFDQRGVEGTPLVRTLRTLLTNNLPGILPDIRRAVDGLFEEMHESHPMVKGAKQSPLYSMVKHAVAHSNAIAFFGPQLAHSQEFMAAAVDFIESTLVIAEVIRLLPRCMAPIFGAALARRLNSHKVLHDFLIPATEERLDQRASRLLGHPAGTPKRDCIQWVIECSPSKKPWSAQRIVHELMALWFGSVHIVSTTICFAMHDLCQYPEYIEPLRQELESGGWSNFEKNGLGLPLLDSFIKESMRLTPVESISTRRKALQPFELSDGTRIDVGQWICTPARAMMRDPANYSQPGEFHGFRFVDPKMLDALALDWAPSLPPGPPSRLTDLADWQVWGTGRLACPGRYYGAAVMKTILAVFLTKYDCELADPRASRWFSWRSFIYPRPSTSLILRPRG